MEFWTDERVATLRTMRENGARVRDITAALGCTKGAVIGKMDRLGLSTKAVPRFWTPERDEVVRRMHADGALFADIGDALGVTWRAIARRTEKLRLPKRGHVFHWKVRRERPRAPRAFKPRLVDMTPPSTEGAVGILDVTGCRWAVSSHNVGRGDHLFCNHPVEGQASYCAYHLEMSRGGKEPKVAYKKAPIPTCLLRVVA